MNPPPQFSGSIPDGALIRVAVENGELVVKPATSAPREEVEAT